MRLEIDLVCHCEDHGANDCMQEVSEEKQTKENTDKSVVPEEH